MLPEEVFGLIVPGQIGRGRNKSGNLALPVNNAVEFMAFNRPVFLK
jgi:hypothetical protein